ncbi:MAG: ATP-binding protein [Campylobacterales bacterium]|nr:ATP-binding protein [Campylobacterales bacterium]
MNNRFTDIKQIFVEGNVFDYVNLDKSTLTYEKLAQSILKPLKLILFYGKPGTGKTFLLRKIYNDLHKKHPIIFFPQPFFHEVQFLTSLYEEIFNDEAPKISGYEHFLKLYKERSASYEKVAVTVLLDEAQLYPDDLIEKIRLMADTRLFKFLFTIHKTGKEDVLAKEYFTTRIWESIELPNSSVAELQIYLEKKFLFHNRFEYLALFKPNQIRYIFGLTRGNLRTVNKLLYKLFEIYEYYEANKPTLTRGKYANTKYIQMAAIDSGLIHA